MSVGSTQNESYFIVCIGLLQGMGNTLLPCSSTLTLATRPDGNDTEMCVLIERDVGSDMVDLLGNTPLLTGLTSQGNCQ
jgi:hypothetical protein